MKFEQIKKILRYMTIRATFIASPTLAATIECTLNGVGFVGLSDEQVSALITLGASCDTSNTEFEFGQEGYVEIDGERLTFLYRFYFKTRKFSWFMTRKLSGNCPACWVEEYC